MRIAVSKNKNVLNELLLATITFRFSTLQQIFHLREYLLESESTRIRPIIEQCSRIKRIVPAGDQEIQITRPLFGWEQNYSGPNKGTRCIERYSTIKVQYDWIILTTFRYSANDGDRELKDKSLIIAKVILFLTGNKRVLFDFRFDFSRVLLIDY